MIPRIQGTAPTTLQPLLGKPAALCSFVTLESSEVQPLETVAPLILGLFVFCYSSGVRQLLLNIYSFAIDRSLIVVQPVFHNDYSEPSQNLQVFFVLFGKMGMNYCHSSDQIVDSLMNLLSLGMQLQSILCDLYTLHGGVADASDLYQNYQVFRRQ